MSPFGLTVPDRVTYVLQVYAEYDNIKFFIYAYYLLIPSLALLIAQLSQTRFFLATVLFIFLPASGSAAVIYEIPQHNLLYSFADFQMASDLRAALPIDGLFLSSDSHHHPLWSLAGQPVL